MAADPPPSDPDAYADWLNARVGAECLERRNRMWKTAYAMAIPRKLPAQTIRNAENNAHGINLKTLARIARRLGTSVEAIIRAAHRRK